MRGCQTQCWSARAAVRQWVTELIGFERLAQSMAHWAGHATDAEGVAEGIWRDLTAWCEDERHHDDMTRLVLPVPNRA